MKHKIFSLFALVFLMCAATSITAHASTPNNTSAQIINVNKTVKVNKTFKIKKVLKKQNININIKNYTFSSSNSKIATVSSKGIVKGIKKGTAVITLKSKSNSSVVAKIKVKVKNRYNKAQLRLMSSIIYSEAGCECYAGKKAVGIVIMNRIRSSRFPNDIKSVVYQSGQFSPVRNGSLNRSLSLYDNGTLNKDCIKAAKEVLNGSSSVVYNGKTIDMSSYLFFSGYIYNHRLQIQHHQFK